MTEGAEQASRYLAPRSSSASSAAAACLLTGRLLVITDPTCNPDRRLDARIDDGVCNFTMFGGIVGIRGRVVRDEPEQLGIAEIARRVTVGLECALDQARVSGEQHPQGGQVAGMDRGNRPLERGRG